MALDHDSRNRGLAGCNLGGEIARDLRLIEVILAAVGVTTIDHHTLGQACITKEAYSLLNMDAAIVRATPRSSAQDEVTIRISGGLKNSGMSLLGQRSKPVRMSGGLDGINCDLKITVRAIFETDRHGQAACELAMDLAFGGARSDRAPAYKVGVVLSENRVEKLGADRQFQRSDVAQQATGESKARVDVERSIEMRIVDQSLPADDRARLFEVDSHDHK